MKRYAFVDVDMTIVDGNLGASFARELFKRGPKRIYLRNPLRFVLYIIKSVHIALLYPFSFLYPVYIYLQDVSMDRFNDLVASWNEAEAERAAERTARKAKVPSEALAFLQALHDAGYTIVLLSASPSIVLKHFVRRLPVPVRYVGSDEWHVEPFTAHVKASIIQEEFGDGVPAVIVGNPRREPFWLATERAIVVRRPQDLSRFVGFFLRHSYK